MSPDRRSPAPQGPGPWRRGGRARPALLGVGILLLLSIGALAAVAVRPDPGADPEGGTGRAPAASLEPSATSPPGGGSPLPTPEPRAARGYLTTPAELEAIAARASAGEDPLADAVDELIEIADQPWDHSIERRVRCPGADRPAWIDEREGSPVLYAKAIAYHLTGDEGYAAEVRDALEEIMSRVREIELDPAQCRLNFAWGTPELVAAADLIESFWADDSCTGPESTDVADDAIGEGPCRERFGNWLVKGPYYVITYSALAAQSNWGAAATNAMATIADYLWDRPDAVLVHREPRAPEGVGWDEVALSPSRAYGLANELALDRMNGYRVELTSSESCDLLDGDQQHPDWSPVKSQITEDGIIPEDARREQHCNIPEYDGDYQNYPQIHLGNLIQQCELMLRRGDRRCYDNVDRSDLADYAFVGPDGEVKTTHLRPGRGSLERAIDAIIVDADTDWRRPSALAVAYRYYSDHGRRGNTEAWTEHLRGGASAAQDLSFGDLTHAMPPGGAPVPPPPVVAPPGDG